MLEDGGEGFSREGESRVVKRRGACAAYKLVAGLVRNAPVAVRSAEFCIGLRRFN